MKKADYKNPNNTENPQKDIKNINNKSDNQSQVNDKAELLKKHKNEPDSAKENLDIPGGRTARPLTNDRHPDKEI